MRRLIAPLLACALVLSSVGAVSAQPEEFQFDPVACAIFFGGEITVEPGADIVLFSGWSAATRGQLEIERPAAASIFTVNGRAVDVTPYFDPLTKLDRKFWLTIWRVAVGSLELGETVDITLDLVLSHPNFDGSFLWPAGSVFNGPLSCHVTGAPTPPEE